MTNLQKSPLIIFITSVFDDPKTGPATFARLVHKFYKEDGINFRIITSDCKKPDENIITVKKTYIKSMVYYKLWKKAKTVIKKFPDNHIIVHFNNAFPYLYFGKIGDTTITQVNDYYTASSDLYRINKLNVKGYIRHYLRNFTESHSLNKADSIIFNSNFTRNFLLSKYKLDPDKCFVIYKSIDPTKLSIRKNSNTTGTLLFIGNNYYLKGLDLLIESASHLVNVNTINIAGPSKLDDKLMALINKLPSNIIVIIKGPLEQSALYSLMRESDILVIPARAEALGVSVIEALGQGIPAITSGEGGLKEVLEGYPTIFSENKNLDPLHLAQNITKVLEEYPYYQSLVQLQSENILVKFAAKQMISKIYHIYDI